MNKDNTPPPPSSDTPQGEESSVLSSVFALIAEVARQLRDLKAHERSFNDGFLAKKIHGQMRLRKTSLKAVWLEFGRTMLFNETLKDPVFWYLCESRGKNVSQIRITEQEWTGIIRDLPREESERQLTRAADWVESALTATGYTVFKECKQVFDKDELTRMIFTAVHEAKGSDSPEATTRFRSRLDFIRDKNQIRSVDGHPLTSKAWQQEDTKDWRHERLDQWLFSIWPLVRHGHWNHQELLRVIDKRFPPARDYYPCQDANELAKHCRGQLGLRIGAKKGRPHHRNCVPGEDIALLFRFSNEGRL